MKAIDLTKLFGATVLVLSLFSTTALQAHNSVNSTTPSDGAVLNEAPSEITLRFANSTYLTTVMVNNAQGENVLADFSAPIEAATSFKVVLPAGLVAGVYIVQWMVVGDDTHEIKGEFTYTVNTR
jgi:copper transport protein